MMSFIAGEKPSRSISHKNRKKVSTWPLQMHLDTSQHTMFRRVNDSEAAGRVREGVGRGVVWYP